MNHKKIFSILVYIILQFLSPCFSVMCNNAAESNNHLFSIVISYLWVLTPYSGSLYWVILNTFDLYASLLIWVGRSSWFWALSSCFYVGCLEEEKWKIFQWWLCGCFFNLEVVFVSLGSWMKASASLSLFSFDPILCNLGSILLPHEIDQWHIFFFPYYWIVLFVDKKKRKNIRLYLSYWSCRRVTNF